MSEAAGPFEPVNSGFQYLREEGAVTAGSLLRHARESSGLHIAALAVALKVPVRKLEALEADRHDLLPDAVFVRALASSVCRTLKIDSAPILALLPQTSAARTVAGGGAGINVPFRGAQDRSGPSLWTHMSRPAVLGGLLLLLAALVLIFMPAVTRTIDPAPAVDPVTGNPANTGAASGESVTLAPSENADSGGGAPTSSSGGSTASAVITPAPSSSIVLSPGASTASAALSATSAVTATSASSAPAAAAVTEDVVVFRATATSWVEVTDAKRNVVLRRTLNAGDSAGVSGALPLAAVVGRADATQVQVRGKPFDLAAIARDNVARFEVR